MKPLLLHYPGCSTCRKARQWLKEQGMECIERDITIDNPTEEELKTWILRSQLPVRKFFNTSGLLYKEQQLKDKLPQMTEEEQIALLATNGKLVKRPLLITTQTVKVGFQPDAWKEIK
ncbi:MAG: arsenate reductase family protein [Bacteroides sp.]|nr:arsenate reductase family protein [Bacteroides sp.]